VTRNVGRPPGGVAWQCLQERDGSGDLVAQYTYAPGYIDSPARQQRDLNGDTDFADTDEVVYYHSNTLHSVYLLSDSASSAVERYRYDAYGGATVLDADGSDDSDGLSDVENPYAFTARRPDAETDLMYYRNRQYSVTLGRFISRDPVGYRDSWNLYIYVSGRPGSSFDPLGAAEQTPPADAYHGCLLACSMGCMLIPDMAMMAKLTCLNMCPAMCLPVLFLPPEEVEDPCEEVTKTCTGKRSWDWDGPAPVDRVEDKGIDCTWTCKGVEDKDGETPKVVEHDHFGKLANRAFIDTCGKGRYRDYPYRLGKPFSKSAWCGTCPRKKEITYTACEE